MPGAEAFQPVPAVAGSRRMRPHDLQHICASLLRAEGRELHPVQDRRGHHRPAFTLSLCWHLAPHDRAVLDCVREQRPLFNPSDVVADFAVTLRAYRVQSVLGDAYAGQWPQERFRAHGIRYELAEQRNSHIYAEVLP